MQRTPVLLMFVLSFFLNGTNQQHTDLNNQLPYFLFLVINIFRRTWHLITLVNEYLLFVRKQLGQLLLDIYMSFLKIMWLQ